MHVWCHYCPNKIELSNCSVQVGDVIVCGWCGAHEEITSVAVPTQMIQKGRTDKWPGPDGYSKGKLRRIDTEFGCVLYNPENPYHRELRRTALLDERRRRHAMHDFIEEMTKIAEQRRLLMGGKVK